MHGREPVRLMGQLHGREPVRDADGMRLSTRLEKELFIVGATVAMQSEKTDNDALKKIGFDTTWTSPPKYYKRVTFSQDNYDSLSKAQTVTMCDPRAKEGGGACHADLQLDDIEPVNVDNMHSIG